MREEGEGVRERAVINVHQRASGVLKQVNILISGAR